MPEPAECPYPTVAPQALFPEIEESVLARWARENTFARSVEARPGGVNEYVFYDGPPFATGLPHYGGLLTGYVKDAVPRYQTMRGRRVERRFGWDCHGLPAEVEAEKELGVAGRLPVMEFGVARFNDACRALVMRYTSEWERYVTRQARWVDFANDYKTMDLPYMESVMWAFKQLYEKGLLYEGYKVLPYCWECETPLSNFETRQDDAYRDRQDPAVTVLFTLLPEGAPRRGPLAGNAPTKVLVWTTTPWTLPSNLALAIGPDIAYAVYERHDTRYVVGQDVAGNYAKELADARLLGTVTGADLIGRRYTPLFGYFADTPGAFEVFAEGFVSTAEGTGVVHLAPGFGEEDQLACEARGLPVVCPVDSRGRFTSEVSDWAGWQVFEANAAITRRLHEDGTLLRHETYVHSYPHCYRTDTPLIYRAVGSWFVRVTALRDRMVELNQQIRWVPSHIRDGAFGKWLENARDWALTRNRFWGAPIPVWKSDDPAHPRVDVYGSLEELERDFGVRPSDLHRPAIDELTRPNPDDPTGRSTMRRVEDVLDCWFESGSMPFAQVHYPFEHREWFESHFPADFIVEYVSQTRGWFYTLHVLATALFDRPPFRACISHGIVLGTDSKKLSKSRQNFTDPVEVFDTYGADALRWMLFSSPVLRGGDIIVDTKAVAEAVRTVLNPVWNVWSFFTLYANTERRRASFRTDAPAVLDRYILAKTRDLVVAVTDRMDALDLPGACAAVLGYIDALTNWYVRRSRARFWMGDGDAFDTLASVLEVFCRLAAPLLPLVTDAIWPALTGVTDDGSVHLSDWPSVDALPDDPALVAAMDRVRQVCSAASSIRKARGARVRMPLARLTVASPDAKTLRLFSGLIAEEVNVKEVELTADVSTFAEPALTLSPAVLGPRLGAAVQQLLQAARAGRWERGADGSVSVLGRRLADDEYTLALVPRDAGSGRALPGEQGVVALDLTPRPELEAEGLARDAVRLVQVARKESGLHVSDRIALTLVAPAEVAAAVEVHRARVAEQTLAVELAVRASDGEVRAEDLDADAVRLFDLDGQALAVGISRVKR